MLSCTSAFKRFATFGIKPLGQRIVIELDKTQAEKVGSLYVPETAQQQTDKGVVKAVGPGIVIKGKLQPTTLKVGQTVLMPKYGGQNVKFQKSEYTIIDEDHILAVFD